MVSGDENISRELQLIKNDIVTFKRNLNDMNKDESIQKLYAQIDVINRKIENVQEQTKVAVVGEIKNGEKIESLNTNIQDIKSELLKKNEASFNEINEKLTSLSEKLKLNYTNSNKNITEIKNSIEKSNKKISSLESNMSGDQFKKINETLNKLSEDLANNKKITDGIVSKNKDNDLQLINLNEKSKEYSNSIKNLTSKTKEQHTELVKDLNNLKSSNQSLNNTQATKLTELNQQINEFKNIEKNIVGKLKNEFTEKDKKFSENLNNIQKELQCTKQEQLNLKSHIAESIKEKLK